MARSIKKGPFIEPSLSKKIEQMNKAGNKRVIQTWARRSTIAPELCGAYACCAHMEINLSPFILQKTWWDTNLVNFAPTRTHRGVHGRSTERATSLQ